MGRREIFRAASSRDGREFRLTPPVRKNTDLNPRRNRYDAGIQNARKRSDVSGGGVRIYPK